MNIRNKKALTLTELLVSILLISIVMVGVVSIEYAIRRSRRVSAFGGDVSMRVSGTVLHVINIAGNAIGHAADPGIGRISNGGPIEVLWVRADTNGTPANYGDDTWSRVIFYRDTTKNVTVCIGGGLTGIGDTSACTGTEYTLMRAEEVIFNLVTDAPTLSYYLEITVTGLYNLADPFDPIRNPRSSYTARVNPLSHTW